MAHSQNLSRKEPGGTLPLVVKSFALTVGSSAPYPVAVKGAGLQRVQLPPGTGSLHDRSDFSTATPVNDNWLFRHDG
jgi:hypothetical protein